MHSLLDSCVNLRFISQQFRDGQLEIAKIVLISLSIATTDPIVDALTIGLGRSHLRVVIVEGLDGVVVHVLRPLAVVERVLVSLRLDH